MRTAAAVGITAVALIGGAAVATQTTGITTATTTATVTVTTTIPCSAVTARGTVNDACTAELAKWQQEFANGLATNTYYPKWKAANPGEFGRLKAWSTSDPSTPQPSVATGYGAVVRFGLGQCRTWAIDLANCVLP